MSDVRKNHWICKAAAAAVLVAVTSTTTYYLTMRGRNTGTRVATTEPAKTDSVGRAAATSEHIAPPSAAAPRPNTIVEPTREPKTVPHAPSSNGIAGARLASNKPSAEQVYMSEITRLRAVVERRRAQLDPVTVSVIERNLKVIDEAIVQCRLALAKDPASRFLMESLNTALDNKVQLLRTATMLPARS